MPENWRSRLSLTRKLEHINPVQPILVLTLTTPTAVFTTHAKIRSSRYWRSRQDPALFFCPRAESSRSRFWRSRLGTVAASFGARYKYCCSNILPLFRELVQQALALATRTGAPVFGPCSGIRRSRTWRSRQTLLSPCLVVLPRTGAAVSGARAEN